MENLRAGLIMIACGEATGGSASTLHAFLRLLQKLLPAPLAYGAADVDLITGTETSPHITQSETSTTANPDNPDQIFVAYNDSRGAAPAHQLLRRIGLHRRRHHLHPPYQRHGQSPFANTFGDPVVLYNKPTSTWFTVWLDANCGGHGLGRIQVHHSLGPE